MRSLLAGEKTGLPDGIMVTGFEKRERGAIASWLFRAIAFTSPTGPAGKQLLKMLRRVSRSGGKYKNANIIFADCRICKRRKC